MFYFISYRFRLFILVLICELAGSSSTKRTVVIYTEGLRHRIIANIDQTCRVVLTNKCCRHRGSNPRHQIGSLESYHTTKRPSTFL